MPLFGQPVTLPLKRAHAAFTRSGATLTGKVGLSVGFGYHDVGAVFQRRYGA